MYDNLKQLTKEQLISIIAEYDKCFTLVGETLVDESKLHITSESAVDKIRNYLRGMLYPNPNDRHLRYIIDCREGRITSEEYRQRILGR